MQKETTTTPQQAISAFEQSCEELARQVNHRLFDDSRDWYWVGDEKGGICDFEDADFLKPEEMVIRYATRPMNISTEFNLFARTARR